MTVHIYRRLSSVEPIQKRLPRAPTKPGTPPFLPRAPAQVDQHRSHISTVRYDIQIYVG